MFSFIDYQILHLADREKKTIGFQCEILIMACSSAFCVTVWWLSKHECSDKIDMIDKGSLQERNREEIQKRSNKDDRQQVVAMTIPSPRIPTGDPAFFLHQKHTNQSINRRRRLKWRQSRRQKSFSFCIWPANRRKRRRRREGARRPEAKEASVRNLPRKTTASAIWRSSVQLLMEKLQLLQVEGRRSVQSILEWRRIWRGRKSSWREVWRVVSLLLLPPSWLVTNSYATWEKSVSESDFCLSPSQSNVFF